MTDDQKTDGNGNMFEDVGNIRITYVDKNRRSSESPWPDKDKLSFRAYKGQGSSLHMGAEIPIDDTDTLIEIIEALCKLHRERKKLINES
jgi:hypothetical protein